MHDKIDGSFKFRTPLHGAHADHLFKSGEGNQSQPFATATFSPSSVGRYCSYQQYSHRSRRCNEGLKPAEGLAVLLELKTSFTEQISRVGTGHILDVVVM